MYNMKLSFDWDIKNVYTPFDLLDWQPCMNSQVAMFCCTTIAYFSSKSWKTGQTEVGKGKKLPEEETVPLIYLHRAPTEGHLLHKHWFSWNKFIRLLLFQLHFVWLVIPTKVVTFFIRFELDFFYSAKAPAKHTMSNLVTYGLLIWWLNIILCLEFPSVYGQ